MGGRGASSGTSKAGNPYGSQYHTIYQSGNIKFVTKNFRDAETLMETMTEGRVYAVVGGNKVTSIAYFDKNNKRYKSIELAHPHFGKSPHTHRGYFHSENNKTLESFDLTNKKKKMVERVFKTWENRNNNQ